MENVFRGIEGKTKMCKFILFYNFLDIFTKSSRITRFCKSLEYATFYIKKFENKEFIAKQSFYSSAELHVCKLRNAIHFEFCLGYNGALQNYITNNLCSSSKPNNNNFFTTECIVFQLLQQLQCNGRTNQIWNLLT